MGAIKKQGINSTLLNYFGIIISALSVLLVYSQALLEYGIITFMIEMAFFFGSVAQGSVHIAMLRFFPAFNNPEKKHFGILGWAWIANLIGFLIFGAFCWIFHQPISSLFEGKEGFDPSQLKYLYVLSYLLGQIFLFTNYCTAFKQVVISTFVDVLLRLLRPIMVLIYIWGYFDLPTLIESVLWCYLLCIGLQVWYIYKMGEWYVDLNKEGFSKPLLKEIGQFSTYTTLLTIAFYLAMQLDRFTVPIYMTFEDNGMYNMALFIAHLISVPLANVSTIATPVAIENFAENSVTEIDKMYKTTTPLLCIAGIFLFLGIMTNAADLFNLMNSGNALQDAEKLNVILWVIFILGIGRTIENLGGVSRAILEYSPAYRWALLLMGIAIICNIGLSLLLIPALGLIAIAIAASVALVLYMVLRVLLLYKLYGIFPMNLKVLWAFIWGTIVYILCIYIQLDYGAIINMAIRSILVTILYIPVILWLEISPELNQVAIKLLRKVNFTKNRK